MDGSGGAATDGRDERMGGAPLPGGALLPERDRTVFEDTDEGLEAARRAGMSATDVRSVYRHEWRDTLDN